MWSYWFAVRPLSIPGKTAAMLLMPFVACLVGAALSAAQAKKLKKSDKPLSKFWQRVSTNLYWFGGVGIFLPFFSYEGIPLFNMRAWYLVWLIAFVVQFARLAWYRTHGMAKELGERHDLALKNG